MRKNLMFVTCHDKDCAEGLSYAIDLAKLMNKGIEILLVHKNNFIQRFENVMTAVTFSEAGEHDTARKIFSDWNMSTAGSDEKMHILARKCQESGVAVSVEAVAIDIVSGIKDFLSKKTAIDMILLSPSVTSNGKVTTRELRKLIKTTSRPIVTIARQPMTP